MFKWCFRSRRDERYGLWTTCIVALLVNLAVLFNWSAIGHAPIHVLIRMLALDAVLLPIATFICVILGVLPLLVVIGLGRALVRSMRRSSGPPHSPHAPH